MKKLNFFMAFMIFSVINAFSQFQLNTVPPLNGGNGQTGVTFNVTANQSLQIDTIFVSFTATGSAEVWYNPNPINGAPTVDSANGWIQLVNNAPINTAVGIGNIQPIPANIGLVIPAGLTYGFYVGGVSLAYTNGTAGVSSPYSDANMTIECGDQVGYGGPAPNPNFHPRQFNGGIKYTLIGGMNDAAVLSVDSPTVFCAGTENVVATIANFGQNQIDSVDVEWEVNGVAQPTFRYIGLLDTISGLNPYTAQVTLGSATFNSGMNDVKVWTSLPNGVQDTSNFNDTIDVDVTSAAPPTAINVTNVTLNSATITAAGGAGTVDYEYGPLGFIQGTGTTGSSPTATFTLTGLNQGSTYDVYVRSNCGSGDSSAWVGPETFNTSYGVPFLQDFENFAAGITGNPWPEGWSSTTTTDPNWESEDATGANENSVATGPLYDHTIFGQSGGIYMYMETSGGTTGDSADFVSPPIYIDSSLTTVELSYWYFNHGADIDGMQVIVDTNGVENVVATYTGQQQANQTDPWLQGSHFLTGYQGKSVVIKFRGYNPPCCSGDLAIDDVRIDPVLPLNAGVLELQSPSGALCPGSITPVVGVKNFGSNVLDSVNVVWDVNGVLDSLTYVGQILPGDTASVSLATLNITAGQIYNLKFYTSQPNGQNDQFAPDDTLEINGLQTGLSGTVTVDATQPASATNFQDFASLTQVLNNYGVCGPTTVNVAVGVYNESIYLDGIPGSSAINNIVITGTDSSQTIVRHDGSVNYATLTFDGASHVSVKNMTIEMTGNGDAVIFAGGAEYDTLSNCVSRVPTNTTTSLIYNISFSGNPQGNATGADANYNVVQNNLIIGGYYGIRLYGSTTNLNTYNQIINNQMDSVYYYGIYSYYQDSIEIIGNKIDMLQRGNVNADGAYMYYSNNTKFSKNYIWAGDYGVYFYNFNTYAPVNRRFEVSNNMIYSASDYGVYMYYVDSVDFWHNSIHVEGTTTPALQINSSTSAPIGAYDVRNNILSSLNTEALETNEPDTIFDKFNNNVYYTQSGTDVLNIDGTGYTSLAAYQTAQPLFNTASLEGDPEFISNIDLHIVGAFVNDGGDNSVNITEDIDGDIRPMPGATIVDIGADEFDPPSCPPPSNAFVDSVQSNSAIAYWTPNTLGNDIEYELVQCGNPLGSGIQGVSIIDSVILSNLNSSTCYEFYLREICTRGDTSVWGGPYAFTTNLQGPVGVNCNTGTATSVFVEEFDNLNAWTGDIGTGATGGDWNSRTGGTGSLNTGPSGAHSGNNYAYVETSGGTNQTISIVSPLIDLTQATDSAEMSFWMHAYGATIGTLNVGVSTSATGPFTNLFTWTGELQTAETDPFQQIGIRLDSYVGQAIYIEIEYLSGTSFTGDIAIDLLEINSCVSCPSPSSQTALNAALTSVDLDWIENGSATDWEIEYDVAGYTQGTGTVINTTQKPYSLSGLTPSTSYEYYVRAICGVGDTSAWEGPFVFNTAYGIPYLQDFENFPAAITSNPWPENWSSTTTTDPNWESETGTGANANSVGTGPLYDHTQFGVSGGIYIYMETSGGTTGDTADFVSPPIYVDTFMTTIELSYWYFFHGGNIDRMEVIIDTNGVENVVSTITGQQQLNQADPWLQDVISLSGYEGSSVVIKFRGYNVACCDGDIAIDDVRLRVPSPQDGGITDLFSPVTDCGFSGSDSVSVEVTNFGTANLTNFDLAYQVNNGTPVVETFTDTITPGNSAVYTFATTTSLVVPGTYSFDVYTLVTSDGDASNDTLENVEVFNTLLTIPSMSDFESVSTAETDTFSNGWIATSNSTFEWQPNTGTTGSLNTGPSGDHTSGSGVYMYTEASSGSQGDTAWLTSPCVDLTSGINPGLVYWYHMYGSDIVSLEVQIDSLGTWVTIDTIFGAQQTSETDPYLSDTINLNAFNQLVNTNIRFEVIRGASFEGDVSIDDVELLDLPVGIDQQDRKNVSFQVYPNPSNGLFTLNISTEKAERYHLSVRDVQGKMIYEEEISVNGAYREELDLKGLAKGVYYLQVQNDKASKVEKLIIQ